MARRHPDLVPVTIEKVRYGFTVDGIICEYAQGRAPNRRLERAPGQANADAVSPTIAGESSLRLRGAR
jgi:hypothetical protein